MITLARRSIAERWVVFLGAGLMVALGVAVIESSLVMLLSASTQRDAGAPGSALALLHAQEREAAVATLAVTLGFTALMATFVIASTFAAAVDQRRRELALLRLAGMRRSQLRRMIHVEALLLGGLGSMLGVPLGVAVLAAQTRLLRHVGLVASDFDPRWSAWVPAAAAGAGVLLSSAGAWTAARRAARVAPLDALSGGGGAARPMSRTRWILGTLLTLGAIVLVGLSPIGGAAGGQAMATSASLSASLAAAALAPALVTWGTRLVPTRRARPERRLAVANVRDAVRRNAALAAPVAVLTGIVIGQVTAATTAAAAGVQQRAEDLRADLVLETTGPPPAWITALPGVRATSTEVPLAVRLTTGEGDGAWTAITSVTVVDPEDYAGRHALATGLRLDPGTVAAGPGGTGLAVGEEVDLSVGGTHLRDVPVAEATDQQLGGATALLIPVGTIPAAELAALPTYTFLAVAEGQRPEDVRRDLAQLGTVTSADDWLEDDAEATRATTTGVLTVVLLLGALFGVVGMVNSVIVAGTARTREYAVLRAAGLTRRQVRRTVLTEAVTTTTIGLAAGVLAGATTAVAMLLVTGGITGAPTLVVPWQLVVLGAIAITVVVGGSALAQAVRATRSTGRAALARS